MKRFVLIFFFVSLLGSVFSQPYQSIYGDTSTTWSLVKWGYCDDICSAYYSPESDTIINLNTYQVLPNYGFIREDSVQGKVWYYDEFWSQEFLVMDLGLAVSDTFIIYDWLGNPDEFIVDSISMLTGKKHVYLNGAVNMCGMEETLVFVEGSGPNAGFNYQRLENGSYLPSYMLCHEKNDIKIQGNALFLDSCEICMVGIEELQAIPKDVIKICDYLGRETPVKKNTPLIFYYSDGTIRKVMIVE
jgi:hypothetical protein